MTSTNLDRTPEVEGGDRARPWLVAFDIMVRVLCSLLLGYLLVGLAMSVGIYFGAAVGELPRQGATDPDRYRKGPAIIGMLPGAICGLVASIYFGRQIMRLPLRREPSRRKGKPTSRDDFDEIT